MRSLFFLACFVGGFALFAACSTADLSTGPSNVDAGLVRRDGAPVDPSDAGTSLSDAAASPSAASCDKYCDLVMANCTGDDKQYASTEECTAFCTHLPTTTPMREEDVKTTSSVGCRQYWADSPAHTSPKDYCLAAGPFGGNQCGDRCTTFCAVLLSACAPDAGGAPYATQPDCATACSGFAYVDAGADGGGESPSGPTAGNTLNCRLYYLRTEACTALQPDGGACN